MLFYDIVFLRYMIKLSSSVTYIKLCSLRVVLSWSVRQPMRKLGRIAMRILIQSPDMYTLKRHNKSGLAFVSLFTAFFNTRSTNTCINLIKICSDDITMTKNVHILLIYKEKRYALLLSTVVRKSIVAWKVGIADL